MTTAGEQAVPSGHGKDGSCPFHSAQQLPGRPGVEKPNLLVLSRRLGHEQFDG